MGGLSFKPVRVPCSSVVELPQCKSRVAKFHSCFFSLFCRRETPNTQYTTAAWIERIVILGISNAPKGILLTADGRWLDQLFRQYCIQWLLFSTTLHRLLDVPWFFFSLLQEFSDLTLQSDNFPVVYLCLFFFFVCLFCACVYLKCSLKHHACLGTLPCGGAVIEERNSSINVLFTAESHLQGKETT